MINKKKKKQIYRYFIIIIFMLSIISCRKTELKNDYTGFLIVEGFNNKDGCKYLIYDLKQKQHIPLYESSNDYDVIGYMPKFLDNERIVSFDTENEDSILIYYSLKEGIIYKSIKLKNIKIKDYEVTNNNIYVSDFFVIYKYDLEGNFINCIYTSSNMILDFFIIQNKDILVCENEKDDFGKGKINREFKLYLLESDTLYKKYIDICFRPNYSNFTKKVIYTNFNENKIKYVNLSTGEIKATKFKADLNSTCYSFIDENSFVIQLPEFPRRIFFSRDFVSLNIVNDKKKEKILKGSIWGQPEQIGYYDYDISWYFEKYSVH